MYQVIIDGIVIDEKKTSTEYNGCILLAGAIYTFFNSDNIALVLSTFHASKKVNQDIAITFDSLKNLKNI